jgi:hypothetical protein
VLFVEYQVRTALLSPPAGTGDAARWKSALYSAAVFHVFFDQPMYLNGTLSLHALSTFVQLRPEYRQALYGLARLRCTHDGGEAARRVVESFPAERGDAFMGLPLHLLPLPQARYAYVEWLNVLGLPEARRANESNAATNVLSFLLLLSEEKVHWPSPGSEADAQREAQAAAAEAARANVTVRVSVADDGSIVQHTELFPAALLPRCELQLLAQDDARDWPAASQITALDGAPVSGTFALRAAEPALRRFHGAQEVVEDFHRLEEERLFASPWAARSDPAYHVFLQEAERVRTRVKFGMGLIIDLVADKLKDYSLPAADRMNEHITPALSKGLIEVLDGEGAPGANVASSGVFPAFIQVDVRDATGDADAASSRATTGASTLAEADRRAAEARHGRVATSAEHRAEIMRRVEEWRSFVRAHPEQYLRVYEEDGRHLRGGPIRSYRFRELRPDEDPVAASRAVEEERSGAYVYDPYKWADMPRPRASFTPLPMSPRFEQLFAENERAKLRTGAQPKDPVSRTEPGILDRLLIKFFIKELTNKLTESITPPLSDSISEDVHDLQVETMKEHLREEVVQAVKMVVPAAVTKTTSETIPDILDRILPPFLTQQITGAVTCTFTRAMTHALATPVALSLSRPLEEQYICSLCDYSQQNCNQCSWNENKRKELLYRVDFLADFYSDLIGKEMANCE